MRGFGLICATAGWRLQGEDEGGDGGIGQGQGRNSSRSSSLWEAGIAFTSGPLHVRTLFAGDRSEVAATEFKIYPKLQNLRVDGMTARQMELYKDCRILERNANSVRVGQESTSKIEIGRRCANISNKADDYVTISASTLRAQLDEALPNYPWLSMISRGQSILPLMQACCSLEDLKENSAIPPPSVLAVIEKGRKCLPTVSGSWRPVNPAIKTLLMGLKNAEDVGRLGEIISLLIAADLNADLNKPRLEGYLRGLFDDIFFLEEACRTKGGIVKIIIDTDGAPLPIEVPIRSLRKALDYIYSRSALLKNFNLSVRPPPTPKLPDRTKPRKRKRPTPKSRPPKMIVPPTAGAPSEPAHEKPGQLSSDEGSTDYQLRLLDWKTGEKLLNPVSSASSLYYYGHDCSAKTEEDISAEFQTRLSRAITESKCLPLLRYRSQSCKVMRRLFTPPMNSADDIKLDGGFRKRLKYLLTNVIEGLWRPSTLICNLIKHVANKPKDAPKNAPARSHTDFIEEFKEVLNSDIESSKEEDPLLQKALKLLDDMYCLTWLVWADELKASTQMTFKQLPLGQKNSSYTVNRNDMRKAVNDICFGVEVLDRYLCEAFVGTIENRNRKRRRSHALSNMSEWPKRLLDLDRPYTSSSSALQMLELAAFRADQDKQLLSKFPALTDTTEKSHILVRKLFYLPGSREDQLTVENCEEAARARRMLLADIVAKEVWNPSTSTCDFLRGLSSTAGSKPKVSEPKVIAAYSTALFEALQAARDSSYGDVAAAEDFLTLLDDLVCIKMTVTDETNEMVTVKLSPDKAPCTMRRKNLQTAVNNAMFKCQGSEELVQYMKVALRGHKEYNRLLSIWRTRKSKKKVTHT